MTIQAAAIAAACVFLVSAASAEIYFFDKIQTYIVFAILLVLAYKHNSSTHL